MKRKYTAIYITTKEIAIEAENINDAISRAEELQPDMQLIEVFGFEVKSKDYQFKIKLK